MSGSGYRYPQPCCEDSDTASEGGGSSDRLTYKAVAEGLGLPFFPIEQAEA